MKIKNHELIKKIIEHIDLEYSSTSDPGCRRGLERAKTIIQNEVNKLIAEIEYNEKNYDPPMGCRSWWDTV
jgi:hypothetical protein